VLVKGALDDLYPVVKRFCGGKGVDAEVRKACVALSESYDMLTNPKRPPIDYSSLVARYAYLYTYVGAHSRWTYDVLMETPETKELLRREKLTVTSLGGGPGTELVAMVKAAKEAGKTKSLICFPIDKVNGWGETWANINDRVGAGLHVSTFLRSLDLTEPPKFEELTQTLQADIVFAAFFLSEIYTLQAKALPALRAIAAELKQGAIVVYLDNNTAKFTEFATKIFAPKLFEEVRSVDAQRLTLSNEEQTTSFGDYPKKFNWQPRLKANVSIRVWRKK